MTEIPTLRIRPAQDKYGGYEVWLGGVNLVEHHLTALRLDMQGGYPPTAEATLTFMVLPDVELPAEITVLLDKKLVTDAAGNPIPSGR
jgi:hypothetical protein